MRTLPRFLCISQARALISGAARDTPREIRDDFKSSEIFPSSFSPPRSTLLRKTKTTFVQVRYRTLLPVEESHI
jgi:hypothetical protein